MPSRRSIQSGRRVTIRVTAETDIGKRRHMEGYIDINLAPNESLRKVSDLREEWSRKHGHNTYGDDDAHNNSEYDS